MLSHLKDFLPPFDAKSFCAGKTFMTTGHRPWIDYETKQVRGEKVDVVILTDETEYKTKPGEVVTNRFEKLTVKVPKTIDIPANVMVELVNPKASIYGDYRNQLSVTADDIRIIQSGDPTKNGKE